jgi:anti-sigma regulatory factor (Ser/Thr protein kinase)
MQSITNKFVFPNQAHQLFTSLRQILDFVSENLPFNIDAAAVNFKLKVVITELLNNAVKHAGNSETAIHVHIDHENIKIEKTDFGNPFNPNGLFKKATGQKAQLSQDALHRIYAVIESENFARFICEEIDNEELLDVNNLSEHFGLLIITKSADEFTYKYDPSSGLNTFIVHLKLL